MLSISRSVPDGTPPSSTADLQAGCSCRGWGCDQGCHRCQNTGGVTAGTGPSKPQAGTYIILDLGQLCYPMQASALTMAPCLSCQSSKAPLLVINAPPASRDPLKLVPPHTSKQQTASQPWPPPAAPILSYLVLVPRYPCLGRPRREKRYRGIRRPPIATSLFSDPVSLKHESSSNGLDVDRY